MLAKEEEEAKHLCRTTVVKEGCLRLLGSPFLEVAVENRARFRVILEVKDLAKALTFSWPNSLQEERSKGVPGEALSFSQTRVGA